MFQQIIIIGRLGQDPEVRMTQTGQAVASLTVACSEKWTGKDGKREEKTTWFKVISWGKLAEICGKYLKKGSLVQFVGKMEQRTWEKDGVKQYSWELVASDMKMLDSKKDDSPRASGGNYDVPAGYAGGYDAPRGGAEEDIPF
jgi:single-strand DNA-binding protein